MALDFGKFMRSVNSPEARYAKLNVRSDVVAAAMKMATDRRSDITAKLVGELLPESEIVSTMMEGRFEKHRGLAVLTTRRVLFAAHDYRGGFLLELQLSDLAPATELARNTRLELRTPDRTAIIDQAMGISATLFAKALDQQLLAPNAPPRRDPLELLAEIRLLHDSGVMTDEEFAAEKARLMDQI